MVALGYECEVPLRLLSVNVMNGELGFFSFLMLLLLLDFPSPTMGLVCSKEDAQARLVKMLESRKQDLFQANTAAKPGSARLLPRVSFLCDLVI